jgi:hypothetical protein
VLSLFLSQIGPVVAGFRSLNELPTATNPGLVIPPGPPGRVETRSETSGTLGGLPPMKPISESTCARASNLLMLFFRFIQTQLSKSWTRISHNPVWAGVIGTVVAAAFIGVVDTIERTLTAKSPQARVERAEISGGTWGPSRLLYRCMPDGKCVAPDHVVFDSIADEPQIGNEAYFMTAKVLGSHTAMQRKVSVQIGDTVLVRALIKNDAAMNQADSQRLVAMTLALVCASRQTPRANCCLSESSQPRTPYPRA